MWKTSQSRRRRICAPTIKKSSCFCNHWHLRSFGQTKNEVFYFSQIILWIACCLTIISLKLVTECFSTWRHSVVCLRTFSRIYTLTSFVVIAKENQTLPCRKMFMSLKWMQKGEHFIVSFQVILLSKCLSCSNRVFSLLSPPSSSPSPSSSSLQRHRLG